jgi:lipoprotein NlpI
MFRGARSPDQVLAAAGDDPIARFYANLYIGLYHEALGNTDLALAHLDAAAESGPASGFYMHMVARVHVRLRAPQR